MSAVTDLVTLNGAEKRLVKAAEQDAVADLRVHGDGERLVIRARLLRELCTGNAQWNVKDRIRMIGGRVEGRLDLSGTHLAHPLEFTDCVFEDIDLRKARAEKSLAWVGEKDASTGAVIADEFESEASLTISGVTVTDVISLHWANVRGDLRLTNSHLLPPGGQALVGRDARVGGTLFMDGPDFHAAGEVCLRSAHVKGDVNCRHARFDNPSGCSIDGVYLVVDGEVLLQGDHIDAHAPSQHGTREGFRSDGEVSLQWAQVHRLRATGGKFTNRSGFALHADALHAEDGVYLDRGFEATAEVRLVGAHIRGELCCTRGTFSDPSGLALNAERIEADDVYLDRGFTARGQVRFTDAKVSRQFNATGGDFHNEHAGEYALDADGLICGGEVFLNEGFHALGAVSLSGAEIKGQLNCTAGFFETPDGYALFADGLTTPGMVYLDQGFRAIGEVRLSGAEVGRQLQCTDGTFDNQHGIALDMTGVVCHGDVLLNSTGSEPRAFRPVGEFLKQHGTAQDSSGVVSSEEVPLDSAESKGRIFRAVGEIRMRDAQIGRNLDFTGARLHGDEGLDARGMKVGGTFWWILDHPPEGRINLSRAQISTLNDTAVSWPECNYSLAGMTFQVVGHFLTLEQRITWLRHTDVYSPGVYEQLADAYRQDGQETSAQKITIAHERDRRERYRGHLPRHSRAWSRFIDITVGYGYRLHRPFIFLLVMMVTGWVLYLLGESSGLIYATQASHTVVAPQCPAGYPCFTPWTYTLQLLIPILDLREAAYWFPNAHLMPWGLLLTIYTWMMIVTGWVVILALIPGINRYIRQR